MEKWEPSIIYSLFFNWWRGIVCLLINGHSTSWCLGYVVIDFLFCADCRNHFILRGIRRVESHWNLNPNFWVRPCCSPNQAYFSHLKVWGWDKSKRCGATRRIVEDERTGNFLYHQLESIYYIFMHFPRTCMHGTDTLHILDLEMESFQHGRDTL